MEYVLSVDGKTVTASSSATSTTVQLNTISNYGTYTYTWSLYARYDSLYNPSISKGTFKTCVMSGPGSLTLTSPTANVDTAVRSTGLTLNFSWKLSSFGHACNYDTRKFYYELYIKKDGVKNTLHGTCLLILFTSHKQFHRIFIFRQHNRPLAQC